MTLVFVLRGGHVYAWELDLTRLLQDTPGRREIFDPVNFLTNTLSWPFLGIFVVTILVAVAIRHYSVAFLVALTFPVHVLAQFPKAFLDRPRPPSSYPGVDGVGGFDSFPSGHAEFVVAFYGLLLFIAVRHARPRWARAALIASWGLFALATGYGRVATGRHWPIDILASYLIGFGILSGLLWLYEALRAARPPGRDEWPAASRPNAYKASAEVL
ncbi:MAG: phosphatase PAP2 family protein [Dehalococcoidia bacterium]